VNAVVVVVELLSQPIELIEAAAAPMASIDAKVYLIRVQFFLAFMLVAPLFAVRVEKLEPTPRSGRTGLP
jgi:hypothetical protein